MRVALSTHLFLYQTLDENLLKLIKSQGFSNLEIWGMRPHFDYYDANYITALAESIKKLDMKVIAVHAPFYTHVQEAKAGRWLSLSDPDIKARQAAQREVIALLKVLPELDCPLLVLHPGGLEDQATQELQNNLKQSLQVLLQHCPHQNDEMGSQLTENHPLYPRIFRVKIALENINSELGTPEGVLQLVKNIASPNLGMCLDLGHANLRGNVLAAIDKAANELIHIHASDNDGQKDLHQIPFEGNIDWQKVQERLTRLKYKGSFSWELRHTDNPATILSKIYAYSGKIFPFFNTLN